MKSAHFFLCFVVYFSAIQQTSAQTSWTGANGTNWNDTGNWTAGIPVDGTVLNFSGIPTNQPTSNDIGNLTTGAINFTNNGTVGQTQGFTLGLSNLSQSITLGGNITTTAPAAAVTGPPAVAAGVAVTDTINLNLNLNGDRTITTGRLAAPAANHSLTVNGLISGGFGLVKAGGADLTLTNTSNSFSGPMTINSGIVIANALASGGQNSAIGSGSVINFAGGALSFNGAIGGTIDRIINLSSTGTGGGRIDNNGSVALTFNGAFTNSGTANKTFSLGGANTGENVFVSTLIDNGGALTNSGALTLAKLNGGTWTVSGANTYIGNTLINQGTLNVSAIADSGSSNIGFGSVLRLGEANNTGTLNYRGTGATTARQVTVGIFNGANGNGGGIINNNGANGGTGLRFTAANFNTTNGAGTATRTLTLSGSNTDKNEIAGAIANSGLNLTQALTKAGTGRWILGGTNSYGGLTTVSGGVLQLNNADALPMTGSLTLSGGVIGLGAANFTRQLGTGAGQVNISADNSGFAAYGDDRIVNLGGASAAVTWASGNFMTAGNNFVLGSSTATHTVDFQNGVVLSATRFFRVDDGAAAVDARLSGAITGNTTFSKAGAGTLELTNSDNAWTGTTFVDSGTLRLGADNVLPGPILEIKRGAGTDTNPILDLNGFSDTVGQVILGSLTTSVSNAGQTVSIINSAGGSATLTLGGNLTYRAGTSDFLNGQATISANLATGNVARNIVVGDGVADDDLVISGAISGSNNITKQGAGTLLLSGANTHTGAINIRQGTLKLGAAGALPDANSLQLGAPASADGVIFDINGISETVGQLILGSPMAGTAGLTHSVVNSGAPGALLTLNGQLIYSASTVLNGQATISVNINPGAAARTFNIGVGTANATADVVISGEIQGATSGFVLIGGGTLMLTNSNNSYGGDTTIRGGSTLKLGENSVLGGGTVFVASQSGASPATLDLNGFTDTLGGAISVSSSAPIGAGATSRIIDSVGGGVLRLNGNVNYAAGGGGNNNGTSTISAALDLNGSQRTFAINDSDQTTQEVVISGAIQNSNGTAGLTKTLGGTLVLSGANTYNGPTTVTSGSLMLSGSGSLADASAVNVDGAAGVFDISGISAASETVGSLAGMSGSSVVLGSKTLVFGGDNNSTTFAGVASGIGGGLTKNGSGAWTLSGDNSYSGATLVNGGTLVVNNITGSATGTGAVTIAAGATLAGSGSIAGATTIHGSHSPGNSPGIQTFGSNLTYSNMAPPDTSPVFNWELVGNTAVNASNPNALFDSIVVGGNLSFIDTTNLNLSFNGVNSLVDWTNGFWDSSRLGTSGWLLYDVAGTTNNFSNLSLTTANWLDGSGQNFNTHLAGSFFSLTQDGNDIYLNFNAVAVPEPSSILLLGLATTGMVAYRRRLAKRNAEMPVA